MIVYAKQGQGRIYTQQLVLLLPPYSIQRWLTLLCCELKRGHAIDYGNGEDDSGSLPPPPMAEEREQSVSHHSLSHNPAICLSLLDTQCVAGPGQTH